jgi:phosphoribosylcarboxyaminoimidazole (NCAIR) mutase
MVHMPSGVPVAVAGVGKTGAVNAAILAVEILGVQDSGLRVALADYKKKLAEGVEKGSEEVKRELGVGD